MHVQSSTMTSRRHDVHSRRLLHDLANLEILLGFNICSRERNFRPGSGIDSRTRPNVIPVSCLNLETGQCLVEKEVEGK